MDPATIPAGMDALYRAYLDAADRYEATDSLEDAARLAQALHALAIAHAEEGNLYVARCYEELSERYTY